MSESKWGPEMDEEVKAAAKRLRQYVDAAIAAYGKKAFLPRSGPDSIPSLALADVALVLKGWEGPHGWAVAEWREYPDDGEKMLVALHTFLYEEEAVNALVYFGPGVLVAWWDEGGSADCWRPR